MLQLMDQKKASEPKQDNNFQVQGQLQMPPQQQWSAHPEKAQAAPNMLMYQNPNQLHQSLTLNPNLNMNVTAICCGFGVSSICANFWPTITIHAPAATTSCSKS